MERVLALPGARRSIGDATRRGRGRAAARASSRSRSAAPDERRPARRDAQRRARLEPDRRADGAQHDRAGEDVLGRVRRGRRGNELADARSSPASSAPTTTSSSSRPRRGPSISRELVWHLDEPLADLSALGFLALSELAAQHVTVALSGQGADELLGGYRKHRAAALADSWQRLPGPARAARGIARCGARPRAARAVQRGRLPLRDPAERLLAMSGSSTPACAQRLVPRAARGARRATRRSARSCDRRGDFPTTRSPATLYLDAQLGARRRHAPLLRPHVDGALARGARAVPRPPPRRALRDDSRRAQGAAARDEARPQARRARPRPRPDHRQAEARLLQRGCRRLVPERRRAARSPTTCSSRHPATPSCSTAEVERLVAGSRQTDTRAGTATAPALDPRCSRSGSRPTCRARSRCRRVHATRVRIAP